MTFNKSFVDFFILFFCLSFCPDQLTRWPTALSAARVRIILYMNPTDVCLYALCASGVMNMHVFVCKFVCSMYAFSCMKFHLPIVLFFASYTESEVKLED